MMENHADVMNMITYTLYTIHKYANLMMHFIFLHTIFVFLLHFLRVNGEHYTHISFSIPQRQRRAERASVCVWMCGATQQTTMT